MACIHEPAHICDGVPIIPLYLFAYRVKMGSTYNFSLLAVFAINHCSLGFCTDASLLIHSNLFITHIEILFSACCAWSV